MTTFEKLTSKALSLPEENRAELAEILIQSLNETEDEEIKIAWLQEILRRDREIRAGEDVCRSAEEVLKEARRKLLYTK